MFSSGCHVDFHAVFCLKKKKNLQRCGGGREGGGGRKVSQAPQDLPKLCPCNNMITLYLVHFICHLCLPFNIRHKLGKEAVFGLEFVTGLSFEQQFLVSQVHANNSAKFTQIHSRNHLLKSDGKFK